MSGTTGDDVETRLGEYAAGFAFDETPREVVDKARLVLLDTVGVCVNGADTQYVPRAMTEFAGLGAGWEGSTSGRGSTVFATGDRGPPEVAALVNAAGGTTLELDEGNQRSGHPAIHVVPPAVAVAEHVGASGRDLLEAILVAYEISSRLGSLNRPLKDGLHPHAEWATVGGAVATGKLLGFTPSQHTEAIRIAANPFIGAHWAAALEGATVRDFYTGLSCRHGITAATLAAAGVTGMGGAIERCLLRYTAAEEIDADAIDATYATLGEAHFLSTSYFKVHAACRYTHAPIEALEALLDDHGFEAEAVDRIVVRTFALGTMLDDPHPTNALSAKFSTPYAMAARLVAGTSDVEAFRDPWLRDEEVRRLAERVEVVTDSTFEAAASDGKWGAAVEVELDDGTVMSAVQSDARGGGDTPFSRREVVEKFDRLVDGATLRVDRDRLRERLLSIEDVADVADVFDPLRD